MDIKSEVEIKGEILDIIQEEKPEMKDDILGIIEEEKQIENVNEELIFVEPLQQYFSEEEIEVGFYTRISYLLFTKSSYSINGNYKSQLVLLITIM